MTKPSTTIRVTVAQRQRLRELARKRSSTMTETLDAALEALRRNEFYRSMAAAEAALKSDPDRWAEYLAERDAWLGAELT